MSFAGRPSFDDPSLRYSQFAQRLLHCHGPKRAALILAGKDHATNLDIVRWNSLGDPKLRVVR